MKLLSVVIPVYNERQTLEELLKRVQAAETPGLEKEIIIIDDCSTDGTRQLLQSYEPHYKVFYQTVNQGKGAAVTRGLREAAGDIVIIQDADLEYDPSEYQEILQPIVDDRADVVFGSRFIGNKPHRVLYYWHYFGNRLLTMLSNMFTNLNLTDMETCYKAFNRQALDSIKDRLTARRFGIEPEITALVAKQHLRIYEVGISYFGRTYGEGKKINWKDGFAAIYYIIKSNLFSWGGGGFRHVYVGQ